MSRGNDWHQVEVCNLSLAFPFADSPEQADKLGWTACLAQLGCGGTFLNHGLGKPPRLRAVAIGSMRRPASWSRASSEALFLPRALEVGSAVLDLQGPGDVIKSRECPCAPRWDDRTFELC